MIWGWNNRYIRILAEFGYSRGADAKAARILDKILDGRDCLDMVKSCIKGRNVIVAGAGPSLPGAIPALKSLKNVTIIAADSAAKPLVDHGIIPDIVVSDLDGDMTTLIRLGTTGTMFVIHAHGDNIDKLPMASYFANRMGTSQGASPGRVADYGGFTDGDRSVFLADRLGARRIILAGMDLDGEVGSLSNTKPADHDTKIKKLRKAKELLEWFAGHAGAELYTTSGDIKGFTRITPSRIADMTS